MDYTIPYAAMQQNIAQESIARMPTLKERLELKVRQCEKDLADAKRAREILDENPQFEELLNIIQKGRF